MKNKPDKINIYCQYEKVFNIIEEDIKDRYSHVVSIFNEEQERSLKLFNSIHILTTCIVQPSSKKTLLKRYFDYEGDDYLEVLAIINDQQNKFKEE